MNDAPDFTAETRAILDALASAYRRGCSDTIARLMAGAGVPSATKIAPPRVAGGAPASNWNPPRAWNDAEDDLVRSEWGKSSPDAIGAVMNRSGDAIRIRAKKLGLPRLPRFAFLRSAPA